MPQRDEERWALEEFRKASGELPGEVQQEAPPSPDFVVVGPAGRIGVEMTGFSIGGGRKGSPARETEALREEIMQRAGRLFEATPGAPPLQVLPYFATAADLNRKDVDDIAARISSLVSRLVPPLVPGEVTRRSAQWPDLEAEGLDITLTQLEVSRSQELPRGAWRVGSAGYSSRDVAALEKIVRGKELKLATYRGVQDFKEVWLIIYSPPRASGEFDIDVLEQQPAPVFKTAFDRVVFIHPVTRRYVYLNSRG